MSEFMLPWEVHTVLSRFDAIGREAYIVGGCVRDLLRGGTPHDWDITTECLPNETLALFSDIKTVPTGIAHGTVTVILDASDMPLEITTFRIDGDYTDHRHPKEVTFTTQLAEDCARRDFTVNAMAYHPRKGIIDTFGGQKDLSAHLIRCVGEPAKRFSEDALRILRALRFSSVLDFDIESETQEAVHTLAHTLTHVSKERLWAELAKLLLGVRAADILARYADVLAYVLSPLAALGKPSVHAKLQAAFAALSDMESRLAACFSLCNASVVEAHHALHALTVSNAVRDTACALLSSVDIPLPKDRIAVRKRLSKSPYARLTREFSFAAAMHGTSPTQAQTLLEDVVRCGDAVTVAMLAVNGTDLAACGLQGTQIGQALHTLLDAVMENRVKNEKEALLAYLRPSRR